MQSRQNKNLIPFLLSLITVTVGQITCPASLFNEEMPNTCFNPFGADVIYCPDPVIIPDPVPMMCGLVNGQVHNFTMYCQAYRMGASGYINSFCSCNMVLCPVGFHCLNAKCYPNPSCDTVICGNDQYCDDGACYPNPPQCLTDADCPIQQTCISNNCQPITCSNTQCSQYEDCQYGICYRKYDYFCSNIQPQILRYYCGLARPDESTCPTEVCPFPQQGTVCGVTYDGILFDYFQDCQACKFEQIEYYYAQPCSTVPVRQHYCSVAETCENGMCQLIDFCAGIVCPRGRNCHNGVCIPVPNYCESSLDCVSGQFCNLGVNLCETPLAVDLCAGVSCAGGSQCRNGICVDLCSLVNCPQGTSCIGGLCYNTNPTCLIDTDCQLSEVCFMNRCRETANCSPSNCPFGTCVHGVCS